MKLTNFARRYGGRSGTRQLMEDLGSALEGASAALMLGGGNPSHIPAVQAIFCERLRAIAADAGTFARVLGNYDSPQGHREFVEALAALLRREYGWPLTARNIALTHGSQSAFFLLFNMFGGIAGGGRAHRILLPMTPEYIGYADVGLGEEMFVAQRPAIELLDDQLFKYHVDLRRLAVGEDIAAVCVSRPTNPTGNVITDAEMAGLMAIVQTHDIPLIVDGAYGMPFPHIIFTEATPIWNEHVILCLSLSKLGLPGVRTGIVVADEPIIDALTGMNAILHLATGSIGPALALESVKSGDILRVSRDIVNPFYRRRAEQVLAWTREALRGCTFRIHRPEGAFFLWLWFPGLPISSAELYERLKARGVIVLPGHHFFPGLTEPWPHTQECLRVSYTQDEEVVRRGIAVIAEELRRVGVSADDTPTTSQRRAG
ncbi:MAG: valine--pyruvate transaminase [Chromatiales bacterium]